MTQVRLLTKAVLDIYGGNLKEGAATVKSNPSPHN